METFTQIITEVHPGFIQNKNLITGNTSGTIVAHPPGGSISINHNLKDSIQNFIDFVLEKHKEEFGFEGESRDRYYFLKGFLNSKMAEMPNNQTINFIPPIPAPMPIPDNTNPYDGGYPFLGKQVTC